MKTLVALLFAGLVVCMPQDVVGQMTREQIDSEIARGQAASIATKVPAFLSIGKKSAKGSFAAAMLNTAIPPYQFFVRSCWQWVAAVAFEAKINGKELDRQLVDSQCAEPNGATVRALVARLDLANEIAANSMWFATAPGHPVTAVAIAVDGVVIEPIAVDTSSFGAGSYSILVPVEPIANAKVVEVVATIGSMYQYRKRVPASKVSALLGRAPTR